MPNVFAASCTAFTSSWTLGLAGFVRYATMPADGTSSCRSANRLAPSAELNTLMPVTLPPGRLRLATRPRPARGKDRRYFQVDEFGGEPRQSVIMTFRPAVFDRHVLADNKTGLAESLAKGGSNGLRFTGRSAAEISDDRHGRLLRTCGERPGRRPAHTCNKCTPC